MVPFVPQKATETCLNCLLHACLQNCIASEEFSLFSKSLDVGSKVNSSKLQFILSIGLKQVSGLGKLQIDPK
jgi:hypothetical protein